jgi:ribosome maturation factor RimP
MSDTMKDVELKFADNLKPSQLMEGDLIKVDNECVTIETLTQNEDGFNIYTRNDFDEEGHIYLFDDETIEWYVFFEED